MDLEYSNIRYNWIQVKFLILVMKKCKKIDQMSEPFFTKWQENDFSLVFLSRFAVFTGLWKVNSQASSDQTFSRGFTKVGTNKIH